MERDLGESLNHLYFIIRRKKMKYLPDAIMVIGTLISMWILNFEKIAIEGAITGLVLGLYIGWRKYHDIKRRNDD